MAELAGDPPNGGDAVKGTWWGKALAILGVIIFAGNIALAWWVVSKTSDFITQPLVADDQEVGRSVATKRALEEMGGADANMHAFLRRLVEADVRHKQVSNMQSAIMVAMAFAFGLTAVGFALFVMGIDKAFAFRASSGEKKGGLVLRSTAPGLLCFLLASVIVVAALVQKPPGDFTVERTYPDPNVEVVGESVPVAMPERDRLLEAETKSSLEEILGKADEKEEGDG